MPAINEANNQKPRRDRKRQTTTNEKPVELQRYPAIEASLNHWIKHHPNLSRPEAIRRLVGHALTHPPKTKR